MQQSPSQPIGKEGLIKLILDSYDIPSHKKKRLYNIATRGIENLGLVKHDKIYSYIDYLVDKFHPFIPYMEKFFTRLNHPLYRNSETLTEELIYISNNPNEEKYRTNEKLKKLISQQEDPSTILGRPIIQIEPNIKLGRREYNQNPLALFRKYEKFYGNMSRTQLFDLDPGMYEALRTWKQLEIAIPEIKPKFRTVSARKEKEIINTYKTIKSPTEIAKKLKISRFAVDYYLTKKHKLRKPNKRVGTPGFSKKMIEDIIECLKKCKKSSKVAKCYGITRFTVTKHGRRAGIPILPRGRQIENITKSKKEGDKN